ncbi:hypothetical protein Zmor_025210 [Zophobas morio]|uniref:Uncharacterized protein n=1 Tax=Zophobas morio TaxID=2755281 RepID=A0AA38HW85_9CUCU|nr:hypothetical protein Zmor_025210 [Zophobas morio]
MRRHFEHQLNITTRDFTLSYCYQRCYHTPDLVKEKHRVYNLYLHLHHLRAVLGSHFGTFPSKSPASFKVMKRVPRKTTNFTTRDAYSRLEQQIRYLLAWGAASRPKLSSTTQILLKFDAETTKIKVCGYYENSREKKSCQPDANNELEI